MAAILLVAPLLIGETVWAFPYHYIYPGETLTMENGDLEGGLYITRTWRAHSSLIKIEPLGSKQTRCRVTGVKAGGRADVTCTTTALALDGATKNTVTHTYEFVVVDELKGVSLDAKTQTVEEEETILMEPNDSETVTIAAIPTTSYLRSVRVSSTNENVFEVSYDSSTKKAVLTAKEKGKALLKVEGNYLDEEKDYRKTIYLDVIVAPKLQGISMERTAKEIDITSRENFSYGEDLIYVYPESRDAVLDSVTFTSSDPSVAKITKTRETSSWAYCQLYPLKTGSTVITAKTAGGKTAACKVTVTAPKPASIKVTPEELELYVGDSAQLSATVYPIGAEPGTVTWTSSNPDSIKIDQTGKVTALAMSDYYEYIVARTANGKMTTISVTVLPRIPDSVSLNKKTLNLKVGDTYSLKLTLTPAPDAQYYWFWTSSNPETVSVDENGKLKALKNGTSTITVQAGPEQMASCVVTVGEIESEADGEPSAPVKKGTVIKNAALSGVYKVTSSGSTPEVAYTKPASAKKSSVAVPSTIKVDNVTYRVTSIAADAFKGNKKLTKVTIGKNVRSIGTNAFYGCSKLKTVSVGSDVTTIGTKAFYKCTSLTQITIPSKVTKIGKQAFYGCGKLKTITIKSKKLTAKNVGSSAFKNTYKKAAVKVPKGKAKSYKKVLQQKGLSKNAKIK